MIGTQFILCNRVASDKPQPGGGWLHLLDSRPAATLRPMPKPPKPVRSFSGTLEQWARETPHLALLGLAQALGVSPEALASLRAVYAKPHRAWAFPMCDAAGKVIGIRLRAEDGRKWAVRGSRQGIFLPEVEPHPPVFICEGPTDTAAALTLGVFAIGRPSCNCGADEIRAACKRFGIFRAVIVADHDAPGQHGAARLARELRMKWLIWTPPAKDLRRWLMAGGSRQLMESNLQDILWHL